VTYPVLALAFLAAAVGLAAGLVVVQRRRRRAVPHGGAVLVSLVVLVALTAVFDSLMIAAELFRYEPGALAGPRVGLAPLEDFAYPLATAVLLPALWTVLARPRRSSQGERR